MPNRVNTYLLGLAGRAFFLVSLLLGAGVEGQTIYHVSPNGSSTPPFNSWGTTATNIQDAIDAANAGDTVLVTNGIYATGGRVIYGSLTNRVAVSKPIVLSSVNGQQVTIIQGYQMSGVTNGDSAVRCVYLTNGATLIGFTLTAGATRAAGDDLHEQSGGGVWCESTNAIISNCMIVSNSAGFGGGGAYSGTLNSCMLTGNSASNAYGGGAYYSSLNYCTLSLNSATEGGGAHDSILIGCILSNNVAWNAGGGASFGTLSNCTLTGNLAVLGGGGADYCTLTGCILSGNSAHSGGGSYGGTLNWCTISSNSAAINYYGGGAYNGTLNNCVLIGNWARDAGGGSYGATLNNCVLTGNTAAYGSGGGSYQGTLNNCTLTGNWAESSGGGSYGSALNNCIAWFNTAPQSSNYTSATLVSYCCTTPNPGGTGNIVKDPLLASDSHLSAGSPCRGTGSTMYTNGLDIDGETWANPPSMGADEYHVGAVVGPLTVSITANRTNGAAGYAMRFVAQIAGRTTGSQWSFGDGSVVSNEPYTAHAWLAPGSYPVVLTAFNEHNPGGISATVLVQIASSINFYVAADATNSMAPYNSWDTAASNIQDAVDAAAPFAGATVWVTNGTYATGGRVVYGAMTNRVAVTTPLTLRSVNGPSVTFLQGQQVPGTLIGTGAVRCIYLTNGASLIGFTLTNGATLPSPGHDTYHEAAGGGAWAGMIGTVISNCIIAGNTSDSGGAVYGGTLNDCTLTGNSGIAASFATLNVCKLTGNVGNSSAAAQYSTLNNCIVAGNSATSIYASGGAAYSCTMNSCIVVSNSSAGDGGATDSCSLNNCLLTDNSAAGWGGGAAYGTLSNCTVVANTSGRYGGGIFNATAKNCIIYYNSATNGLNYSPGTISNCCTVPGGVSVITNAPLFVNYASRDLRLSSNSPCINAGNNAFAPGPVDLNGRPRIVGSAVDIGAYEFQGGTTNDYITWLIQYGLSPNISSDSQDSDGDGISNWQEWLADTCPTNANSLFQISSANLFSPSGPIIVSFASSSNRLYTLYHSTNLSEGSWTEVPGATGVPGIGGQQTLSDTLADPIEFYRVGVRPP